MPCAARAAVRMRHRTAAGATSARARVRAAAAPCVDAGWRRSLARRSLLAPRVDAATRDEHPHDPETNPVLPHGPSPDHYLNGLTIVREPKR